jgi:hypothetical protein
MPNIRVRADWDSETRVWLVTSDDVPGLVTQAATMEALWQKLNVIIPELLGHNGAMNDELAKAPPILVLHCSPWKVLCSYLVGFA